jgi:hypothetical protein
MKTIIAAVIAATAIASLAGAADARPHHRVVCTWHHHHKVCRSAWH